MKKRIWAYLLTLVMVVGLLPTVALAEGETNGFCGAEGNGENVEWNFDSETGVLTISGEGAMADWTWDSTAGHPGWLDYYESITSIDIKGITHIGNMAFWQANHIYSNVQDVTIDDTVTSIGASAFKGMSSLKSITIPDSVETIGEEAFKDGGIEYIEIGCGLETQIASFAALKQLESIEVDPQNSYFSSIDGVLYNNDGDKLVAFPSKKTNEFTVPNKVKTIGDRAFMGSEIQKIDLNNVCKLEQRAFENCTDLSSLDWNDIDTLEIGKDAFKNANNLEYLSLPKTNSLKIISASAPISTKVIRFNSKSIDFGTTSFLINNSSVETIDFTGAEKIENSVWYTFGTNDATTRANNCVVYATNQDVFQDVPFYKSEGTNSSNFKDTTILGITNGGTFAEDTAFKAGELEEPSKDGFDFKGWYTKDGTDDDNWGDPATTVTAGQTYYAKWEMEKPQITVEGNTTKSYDGKEAVLSVPEIDGAAYTWYKDNEEVSGATGNTLAVKNVADSGEYKCQVAVGENTAESDVIEVSITKATPSLKITPSAASMRGKGTVTLTVEGMIAGETPMVTCDDTSISVKENGDGTYSVDLPNRTQTYTFTAAYQDNENYDASSADCMVNVKKKSSSSNSSSSDTSSEKTYTVSKADDMENGKVSVSPSKAEKGDKVTITVTPNKGYEINKVTVKDADGDKIEVKDKGEGEYTFTMPASKVEVKATFTKTEETPVVVEEAKPIILTINQRVASVFGEPVVNDVAPVIRNDRTMLPIRFVVENLGGTVAWDDAQNKVTITKGDIVIEIFIGSPFATVNGNPIELDAPAFIENSRTYLPLRFVAENLGATVTWDAATQQVTILPNME